MRLLARTFHFPVFPTGISHVADDPDRYEDVDAARLRIGFVGPASGRVLVSIQAPAGSSFADTVAYWALRGTGGYEPDGVVAGSERLIYGPAALKQLQDGYEVLLDVEPGRRYGWTFAFKPGSGGHEHVVKIGHPADDPVGHGPVLMEVWDAG